MEDVAKDSPFQGLATAGRGLIANLNRSGEDRLVGIFIAVSVAVHLVVLTVSLPWLRDKPPLADDSMDADLVTDLDLPPPSKAALPQAAPAPEARAPAQMLPQLPKKFAVEQPTKPEDSVAEKKEEEKPIPKDAKPVEQPKKEEEVKIKTEPLDDNKMDQKEILKRAAFERLRNEEKTAKTTEAPEKDQIAQLAEILEKNKQKNGSFASASGKSRIKAYGGILKQAVRANYTLPEAYNLKGANMKVVIEITVGERGDLMDLQVRQPSNDPSFDELTVQAVKASVPLPRPPAELAGKPIGLVFSP